MLVYRVGLPVSRTVHDLLTAALRKHRARLRTWRKLAAAEQALLVLAHLHDNVTYQVLAARFRIGVATVFRYIHEGCEVLADMAPSRDEALEAARAKAYVVLDGTVIETDRVRTRPKGPDRAHYSGKIHRHASRRSSRRPDRPCRRARSASRATARGRRRHAERLGHLPAGEPRWRITAVRPE